MKFKKTMGVLLSIVMVLSLLPTTALAVEHTHDYTHSYTAVPRCR